MQAFGGPWTLLKLDILEKYLSFFVQAMKNQNFKLCYIDAFAGSGDVDIPGIGSIPGSAVRAIDYPFDRYIFIDSNHEYLKKLEDNITQKATNKNIEFLLGDCNQLLKTIDSFSWFSNYWRGVIFLDPYAMNLNWDSLSSIANTKAFDVWYLFPLSAVNRVLPRHGNIPESHRLKLHQVLGTTMWEQEIYKESPQLTLFGDVDIERASIEQIKAYIIKRLKAVFPGVSSNPLTLRNPKNNSPLFLLCFAVSNPSSSAINLSLKAVDHILTHT
ncbi:three-Cys-motif partner protein TcmP [Desulfosporosinus metallidurans]|uniref:Three-Cys-motif partner protein TcmP n=1 Tax=Desulfosporosinus metallidurans TaxID=1888891 RepID=A0A1Q8QJC0_9FIRM|nr:three-Cys-motif partner protein TcmP [Desulfosporosinus metallidurans]OLN27443.1 hypothetical protein DSOL_4520 [Desulfosporosinus metallidurans]